MLRGDVLDTSVTSSMLHALKLQDAVLKPCDWYTHTFHSFM
jgi:hypothetical protein